MEEDEQPLLKQKEGNQNQIQKDEQILLTGKDILQGASLRNKKIKIYLDTHISVKYKIQQPTEIFDGFEYKQSSTSSTDQKTQFKRAFALRKKFSNSTNPFDTLADLSQAFGTPSILSNNNESENAVRQLTLKISVDNAWG